MDIHEIYTIVMAFIGGLAVTYWTAKYIQRTIDQAEREMENEKTEL